MTAAADAIRDWIVRQGLEGETLAGLVEGFATRVVAMGVPLSRAHLGVPSIDPAIRAENVVWRRDAAATREGVEHGRSTAAFEQSPIHFLLTNNIPRRRWRLEDESGLDGYALLRDLRDGGHTDYAAHLVRFGGSATTALQGVALTACSDRPGGFSDSELTLFSEISPILALAAYRIALSGVAVSVLGAYVGHEAGSRILRGEIVRGEGHQVSSAIMFADLSGFTAAADASGLGLVGRLSQHLHAAAAAIEEAGGEVLKFMGDGVLAGYPVAGSDRAADACTALLAAARDAVRRNAAVNARHPGEPSLGLDVALHLGEVFYGNVGGGSRLDFTVIGPAVNEASRIERLCGEVGEPILMSADFAACCGAPTRSLGLHRLRGLGEPREIFAPA